MNTSSRLFRGGIILLLAGVLTACGNPQEDARADFNEVQQTLAAARAKLDPMDQLETYNDMLAQLKSVADDYSETALGRAIAAGRSIDGVSIPRLTAKRDALAARAKCYANPTVACLTPFASADASKFSSSSKGALSHAATLICSHGFKAADQAIASYKINKSVYSKDLIQLALAASSCNKPDDVKTAIPTFVTVVPNTNGQRTRSFMSVLATPGLKAGWPMVFTELEKGLKSGAITGSTAARVTLTLAVDYAGVGNTKAALAKYAYLTDTLHYQADNTSRDKMAVGFMLACDAENARLLAPGNSQQKIYTASTSLVTHHAAQALAIRMGLMSTQVNSPDDVISRLYAKVGHQPTISDYFKPTAGSADAKNKKAADCIGNELDQLASIATLKDHPFGSGAGMDSAYGILALVRQKLGQPDQASAALKKASQLRARLLGTEATSRTRYDDYDQFVRLAMLIQLAHNEVPDPTSLAGLPYNYGKLLLATVAKNAGSAAKALSVRTQLGGYIPKNQGYRAMIVGLLQAGKPDEVKKLIAAYPGDPERKIHFYQMVAGRMIAQGDANGARQYAAQHRMIKDARATLKFDQKLLDSNKIGGDRDKAEPIIHEMFVVGQSLDKKNRGTSLLNGSITYNAQDAATAAFKNGYTDLGIKLYQMTTNKNRNPLLVAFNDDTSKEDMTRVLMLAQNNLSGNALGYVVDRAIYHLNRTSK